ncbi:hypothetical protein [Streptomyces sp. NPDC048551]|uniref:hypothetical protein n=1 Tax=Streptomyces sp. NPDC048551 TaxID=3155758 RepID=UPI00341F0460
MSDTRHRAPMRATRAAMFAAVCVTLAAVGHSSMSGMDIPFGWLLGAFAVTAGLAWPATWRRCGPVGIGAALLGAQAALHLAFSASGAHRMPAAHTPGHPHAPGPPGAAAHGTPALPGPAPHGASDAHGMADLAAHGASGMPGMEGMADAAAHGTSGLDAMADMAAHGAADAHGMADAAAHGASGVAGAADAGAQAVAGMADMAAHGASGMPGMEGMADAAAHGGSGMPGLADAAAHGASGMAGVADAGAQAVAGMADMAGDGVAGLAGLAGVFGMAGHGGFGMIAVHLLAGLFCAAWLAWGEAAVFRLAGTLGATALLAARPLARALALVRTRVALVPAPPAHCPPYVRPRRLRGAVHAHTAVRRGPPGARYVRATAPGRPARA